jgi:calcineurin-like phosphoesterase
MSLRSHGQNLTCQRECGGYSTHQTALGWNFNIKGTGSVGTHLHVQTADEDISSKETADLTDLGRCASCESVIGCEIVPVLHSLKSGMPPKFEVISNDIRLNGIILTIDSHSGVAIKIVRFSERLLERN